MTELPFRLDDYFVSKPERPERIDVSFYLSCGVQEGVTHMLNDESPLEYRTSMSDFHILDSKNKLLTGFFTYGTADQEIVTEQSEHIAMTNMLGFIPRSLLSYSKCIVTPEKMQALRDIMDYLAKENLMHHVSAEDTVTGEPNLEIPFYMLIKDESGEPLMGIGYSEAGIVTLGSNSPPKGLELLVA